jgi:hypothetical protein
MAQSRVGQSDAIITSQATMTILQQQQYCTQACLLGLAGTSLSPVLTFLMLESG